MESLVLIKKRLREEGHRIDNLNEEQLRELDQMEQSKEVIAVRNENAFDEYKARFQRGVDENGLEETYRSWTAAMACGCMGPQNGDPYCPCQMRSMTANLCAKIVEK